MIERTFERRELHTVIFNLTSVMSCKNNVEIQAIRISTSLDLKLFYVQG